MFNESKFFVEGTDLLTVDAYKQIYDAIVALSFDADGYGLFKHIEDEDVEKCKWIASIYEVLNDVPLGRMEHIFKYKKIKFDSAAFLSENECY